VGAGQGVFVHPLYKDEKIKFEQTPGADWLPTNLKKLEAKRFDAIYTPDRTGPAYEARLQNLSGKIRIIDVPNTTVGQYTAFSKKNADLAVAYDAALKKVKAKTTYEAMLAPYLK
jgi:ABC-type amino acid transport substrate-binding protein